MAATRLAMARGLGCGLAMALLSVPAGWAVPAPAAAPPSYESLLASARRGDPGLDFTALRMAWAARLAKATGADDALRKKMLAAMHHDQWAELIETGNQVLEQNYLDIDAQMFVAYAYEQSHQPEKAAPHRVMGNGLIKSILASGDGRSQETAFVVISVDEEYAVLKHYRLNPGEQALIHAGDHSYDVLTAETDAHEKVEIYFNIDKIAAIEDAHLARTNQPGAHQ